MIAGPFCTKMMADLGAEVIKVEHPSTGDPARRMGPFPGDIPHPEKSGLFLYLNTNKLGITLNLRTQDGRRILGDLAVKADVVVEDSAAGTASERGLAFAPFHERNNRLVMASITPFGQTGSYSTYKAYPLNTYQSGGKGYITPENSGGAERSPVQVGGYLGEYEAGVAAAGGIMAAVLEARVSGQGQHIDVSKQEALIPLNLVQIGRFPNEGLIHTRVSRTVPYGGRMRCKDGYVQIFFQSEEIWRAQVKLMGNPAWAQDPKFKDHASRVANAREVDERVLEWLKDKTKEDAFHEGQRGGVPIAPFYTAEDVVHSSHLQARRFMVDVKHPTAGVITMPSAPYRFSATPWSIERPAPLLGEHIEQVYCGMLGYTKERLVRLRQSNVV